MNLKTKYLGIELSSPFIVGASPLGDDIDMARRLEDSGASAIVMHSLFEEQLTSESSAMAAFTESVEESNAEGLSYFPESADYSFGPEDYLNHIALLKSRLSIPVIASLNGRTPGGWVAHAKLMQEAGADAIFAEAACDLPTYRRFTSSLQTPVLANMTEFGQTPLFTVDELRATGIAMVLYPLSAFRAMNKAAESVYETIRRDGTQKDVVGVMQTREELYERIGYHAFERKLDALYAERIQQ